MIGDGTRPLSGVDNAWRQMGKRTNLTAITGMLFFEEPVDYDDFRDRLESRLLRFDRFSQRVGGRKRQLRRPYWEPVESFDIETHITEVALPADVEDAFERFVGDLMSRPLDERRPLWEVYLVDGVAGSNAAVFRINHSLADGFALLYVLLGLADDPGEIELPIGSVPEPPGEDGENGDATGGTSDSESESAESGSRFPSPLAAARTAGTVLKTAYDLLTIEPETDTSLRGELGTAKRAAWTDEFDLRVVKALGDAHDATINDIMLAATAGAFRRLLQDRGEAVDGRELRFSVPVNLVGMEHRDESLGNHFGLVFVPIPVGTTDVAERIRVINDRMDERAAGIEAYLVYLTLTFGGYLPDAGQEKLLRQFEDQATGVVTNVPGPTEAFEFAGSEVGDVLFWAPEANDQGLSLSIFSYDGGIRVGVAGDAGLLPEPGGLAAAFETELEAMATAEEPSVGR